MRRPVLLGGRPPDATTTFAVWLLKVWMPVVVMLAVIACESTSAFSSDETSPWMRWMYQMFAGPVPDWKWPATLHILRKTGHFLGYGTLGLVWLRAYLMFWHSWLRNRAVPVWRGYCVLLAIFSTAVVASLDELHQSFLPDRTGMPQDVLLDCAGAVVLIAFCATFWVRRPWQRSVE